MTNAQSDDVFPRAYGNEFESAIMLATKGDDGEWCPVPEHRVPQELFRHIPYQPPRMVRLYDPSGGFLANGYRTYIDDTHLEFCTPETVSPSAATAATRGTELLIEQTVRRYLTKNNDPVHRVARLQKRVVDSSGVRWASHDNFDVSALLADRLETPDSPERRALLVYLMTRSVICGAGFVSPSGMHFAQKIDGLATISGHSHDGSMFRTERESDVVGRARLELRCGDANVSDWATWMRFGSAALLLGLLQMGEAVYLDKDGLLSTERKAPKLATLHNLVSADGDYELTAGRIKSSLDFQRRIAETALRCLPAVTDASSEYRQVAEELLAFCDDVKRVRRRGAEVLSLADRADWPIKLHAIQTAFALNPRLASRHPVSARAALAEVVDRRYDETYLESYRGEIVDERYGWGLRRRDQGAYRLQVPQKRAEAFSRFPEPGTRAAIRAQLLSDYEVSECDWGRLDLLAAGSRQVRISLPDVRQSQLDKVQQNLLSGSVAY